MSEKELLGCDYVGSLNRLSQQTTQMAGGFYQLTKNLDYENRHPNEIDDFVKSAAVKSVAKKAGIDPNDLKPPLDIPEDVILRITEIVASVDPLSLNDGDLEELRTTVNDLLSQITIPNALEMVTFINAVSQFMANVEEEKISFPTKYREIPLVSTDTSLDSFIRRTGTGKLVIIAMNRLVYPYITERYHIPSQLQGTVIGGTGTKGSTAITFTDITKNIGVLDIRPGSKILITNRAKHEKDLKQQKALIDWYTDATKTIRLKSTLLFEIDSSFVIQIYQYTPDNVLSPGDTIKIPK